MPAPEQFTFDPEAKYVYYCDNETVVGTEFRKMVQGNGVDVVSIKKEYWSVIGSCRSGDCDTGLLLVVQVAKTP